MTQTHYTTYGNIRGRCGHRHRTASAAMVCLDRDHAGCRAQGGYSDRDAYMVDGGTCYHITGDAHHNHVSNIPCTNNSPALEV